MNVQYDDGHRQYDGQQYQQGQYEARYGIRASKPQHPLANPDDPPVRRPPRGPKGPLPGPNYLGLAGRTAIVQGQVFLVAVILIVQLWLITDALYELLSGHIATLGWLALVSFIGFVLALIITFWPRRRIDER